MDDGRRSVSPPLDGRAPKEDLLDDESGPMESGTESGTTKVAPKEEDLWKACTGEGGQRCWLWDSVNKVNTILRPEYLKLKVNDSGTGLSLSAHGPECRAQYTGNVGGILADALLQKHCCIHDLFCTLPALATWDLRGVRDLVVFEIPALQLAKALETGKCLQSVGLFMVTGLPCMDKLAQALRAHANLKKIEINYSEFPPEHFKVLLEGIAGMPQLECLKLQWTEAMDGNSEVFQGFLRNCRRLKKLELVHFELKDLNAVSEVLPECAPLEELVVDYPQELLPGEVSSYKLTGRRNPEKMCTVPLIKLPPNLTALDLSIELGDECISEIAEHLISRNSLRDVSILAVKVGDEEALALAAAVERSKCLRNLMFCAQVRSKVFLAFADAVEANDNVKLSFGSSESVYLRQWLVRDRDLSVFSRFLFPWRPNVYDVLTALLQSGQFLPFVNLATGRDVSLSALQRLFDAIVANGRVEQLSLECKPTHDIKKYAGELIFLLQHPSSIRRFYMAKPVLPEQVCVDVLEALENNKCLTRFQCGALAATDRVVAALIKALRRNTALVEMKFAFAEHVENHHWKKVVDGLRNMLNLRRVEIFMPHRGGYRTIPFLPDCSASISDIALAAHHVMGRTSSWEGADMFEKLAWTGPLRDMLSQLPSGSEALTKKLVEFGLETAAKRRRNRPSRAAGVIDPVHTPSREAAAGGRDALL
ncbi:uncharacterized protein LOC144158405 [Haemaphysalis longicornis]